MLFTLSAAAFAALTALNALLLATVFSRGFRFWPAPRGEGWQRFVFWPLFRGGLGLTIAAGALTFAAQERISPWFWFAALPMMLAGTAVFYRGLFTLGAAESYGAETGLATGGIYRYTRNPQSVAAIVAFAGLALAAPSPAMLTLCGQAVLCYVLMPFAEEPRLAQIYGEAYREYRTSVPRFIGWPRG
jgi:protein-S-isoprenylcysteine O-methyltransferase Ste14